MINVMRRVLPPEIHDHDNAGLIRLISMRDAAAARRVHRG
jgi:hypothetical protein